MKPYIICYMMTSVDGRIDCAMTAQLAGVNEYYETLNELDIPTTVSGYRTAKTEMALPGEFEADDPEVYGHEGFSKKAAASGYEVVADSRGTLLWEKQQKSGKPLLVLTSEKVTQAYLEYLDEQDISWIVCGEKHVDVKRAAEILAKEFDVKRLGLVGGPVMNTAFLNASLVDEVDLLIGPGIDGRTAMPSVFEGRKSAEPLSLKLAGVKSFTDGAVLLRYEIK